MAALDQYIVTHNHSVLVHTVHTHSTSINNFFGLFHAGVRTMVSAFAVCRVTDFAPTIRLASFWPRSCCNNNTCQVIACNGSYSASQWCHLQLLCLGSSWHGGEHTLCHLKRAWHCPIRTARPPSRHGDDIRHANDLIPPPGPPSHEARGHGSTANRRSRTATYGAHLISLQLAQANTRLFPRAATVSG